MNATTPWDLPSPYVVPIEVVPADIDAYRHVNNAVYVTWLDRAAWAHSAALGLPLERCVEMDRGMAVIRSTLAYLRAAVLGDTVEVGTWLMPGELRLRAHRRFQLRRQSDGETLMRAEVEYVCLELSSGRPTRSPQAFRDSYRPLAEVAAAAPGLEPL